MSLLNRSVERSRWPETTCNIITEARTEFFADRRGPDLARCRTALHRFPLRKPFNHKPFPARLPLHADRTVAAIGAAGCRSPLRKPPPPDDLDDLLNGPTNPDEVIRGVGDLDHPISASGVDDVATLDGHPKIFADQQRIDG